MVNYPVGDFLIQIKNAGRALRTDVTVKNTKLIHAVALSLKKAGYVSEVKVADYMLTATLAYHKKEPKLTDLRLVSKPGLRLYTDIRELRLRRKPSLLIISTPQGIMSSKEALKNNIGGEVIVEIW